MKTLYQVAKWCWFQKAERRKAVPWKEILSKIREERILPQTKDVEMKGLFKQAQEGLVRDLIPDEDLNFVREDGAYITVMRDDTEIGTIFLDVLGRPYFESGDLRLPIGILKVVTAWMEKSC